MFLKNYQIKVIGELKRFFQTARETRDAIENAKFLMNVLGYKSERAFSKKPSMSPS